MSNEHTVVVGAGAVGPAVPGGLGGEPAGVVGSCGGDAVVDCRTDGRDEHREECDQRNGAIGVDTSHIGTTVVLLI
jgi:hypothetical protein